MVRQFIRYLLATFIVAPLFACSPALAQLGPGGGGNFSGTLNGPLTVSPTWNNATQTFTASTVNVTDTASASGSLLMSLQKGGSPYFTFDKAGTFGFGPFGTIIYTFSNNGGQLRLNANSQLFDFGASGITWGGDTSLIRDNSANILALRNGTTAESFRAYNTYTDVNNGEWATFDWKTTANTLTIGTQKNGTGVARGINFQIGGLNQWGFDTSGNLMAVSGAGVNIGAFSGSYPQVIYAKYVDTITVTVGALITCNANQKGTHATVSDSTLAYSGANLGTAVTGGGSNFNPVICDGTSWKIGG